MTEFYSIKEIANLCNKHKSTVQRKLTKKVLEDINNQMLAIYKKEEGYNGKLQLFFNEYAVKYIMTLFDKELDYYAIDDKDLYELSKRFNDKKHNKNINNIDDLVDYINNDEISYVDKLDKITNLKNHMNKLEDENSSLKIDIDGYRQQVDQMEIHIHYQDEEIKYLRDEVLKEIKKR